MEIYTFMAPYRILITNDDGIQSPGLQAAIESVHALGNVTVVAPSNQQTGAGRGLVADKQERFCPVNLSVGAHSVHGYHADASPAIIVRHALRTICRDEKPDLLISGINYGENLGYNITCSGTVGAALEASSFGIPSIAVSLQTDVKYHRSYAEHDWSSAIFFLNKFANLLLTKKSKTDVDMLKIDIPSSATPVTRWKTTRLARSFYYFRSIDNPDATTPFGEGDVFVKADASELDKESDIYAVAIDGVVSVTPLSLDLTSRVNLQQLQTFYQDEVFE